MAKIIKSFVEEYRSDTKSDQVIILLDDGRMFRKGLDNDCAWQKIEGSDTWQHQGGGKEIENPTRQKIPIPQFGISRAIPSNDDKLIVKCPRCPQGHLALVNKQYFGLRHLNLRDYENDDFGCDECQYKCARQDLPAQSE